MNYGMYLATSGAQSQMARLDVASNNLANVTTPAFRPDKFILAQRDVVRKEDNLPFADSNELLERLGGGVRPRETLVTNADAPLRITNQPLDLALQGDGFFTVSTGPGPQGLKLTRDGRMTIDPQGTLVRATDGAPVLDDRGALITLDHHADISIDNGGVISQDGSPTARLQIATVPAPERLIKAGSALLRWPGDPGAITPGTATLTQGAYEDSGVNPIAALMEATHAAKAAQGNIEMITAFNDTMGRAINTLGRVA